MNPKPDLKYCRAWAEALARSGAYDGANADDLLPRIAIGVAIGLDPGTAAANIKMKKGTASFSAAIQSALLVRAGVVLYNIVESTDEACTLEWVPGPNWNRGDQKLGQSKFTIQQAQRAKLTTKAGGDSGNVWQQYPDDLLFARALTRGIKRYAPELLAGMPAYTPEELGEAVERDGWTPIGTPAPAMRNVGSAAPPPPQPSPSQQQHDWQAPRLTPEQLGELVRLKKEIPVSDEKWRNALARRAVTTARDLTPEQADEMIGNMRHLLAARALEAGVTAGPTGHRQSQPEDLTVNLPLTKQEEAGRNSPTLFPGR